MVEMSTENLEEFNSLYNSQICRLCGQENENGYPLYYSNDGEELSVKINTYLPLRISDDGKFPRWICPGCHLQVESTVQFFTLILSGQEALRILYRAEKESQIELNKEMNFTTTNSETETDENYETETFQFDIPEKNDVEEYLFPPDHVLLADSSQIKRKRGRPPKTAPKTEEFFSDMDTKEEEQVDENCGRGKRQIKVPLRYQEVVQGKELDKVYADMGLIDKTYLATNNDETSASKDLFAVTPEEVIGHIQDDEGVNLGDLIVINQGKKNKKLKKHIKKATRFMCDICKVCFSHEQKFLQHRLSHQIVRFECTECLQNFKDRNSIMEHQMKESHQGEGIIEDFEYLPPENLDNSPTKIKLVHIPYEDLKQQTLATSEIHPESETLQNEYDMNIGLKNMADIDDPPNVSESHSQDTNPLDDVFQEIDEMEKAAKVLHELQKSDSVKLTPTPNDQKISENFNFDAFSAPLEGDVVIETINKEVAPENEPESDMSASENKFVCKQCKKVFYDFETYIEHKNVEHNNSIGRRFICSKCSKSFKSKQLLQRHQLVHSELRPYKCDTCGSTFKTKTSLTNHEAGHTDDKKFVCSVCSQRFVHKHSLRLHLRLHTGCKPFKCPECNKGFTQYGNMQEHMRIHTGERPFPCTICSKRFKTSSQCRMHIKRHETNRPLKCSKCEKSFVNVEDLRVHDRRHDNIKPFNCDKCDKSFIDVLALKKHIRLHTGEKPFGCTECGRHFADRSNLNKHQKLHERKRQMNEFLLSQEEQISEEGLATEISAPCLDDQSLILSDPNAIPIDNVWNIIEDNTVNPTTDLDMSTAVLKPDLDFTETVLKPLDDNGSQVTKQVVYVTYQDPNNPIGNKTTLYVVQ